MNLENLYGVNVSDRAVPFYRLPNQTMFGYLLEEQYGFLKVTDECYSIYPFDGYTDVEPDTGKTLVFRED